MIDISGPLFLDTRRHLYRRRPLVGRERRRSQGQGATRHDLAVGISGLVDAVLEKAQVDPSGIKLVSMSTTLATNALVEGRAARWRWL
jgi:hypothetical protein